MTITILLNYILIGCWKIDAQNTQKPLCFFFSIIRIKGSIFYIEN